MAGIFALLIAAAIILRVREFVKDRETVLININGQRITADVRKTPLSRAKGLSGRKSLDEGAGMLFVFDADVKPQFWMKDMNFPLDFIWIRGEEIRDLSPNIPFDYPGLLTPRDKVDKVLEVNAGFIEHNDVKIGDAASIDNK